MTNILVETIFSSSLFQGLKECGAKKYAVMKGKKYACLATRLSKVLLQKSNKLV